MTISMIMHGCLQRTYEYACFEKCIDRNADLASFNDPRFIHFYSTLMCAELMLMNEYKNEILPPTLTGFFHSREPIHVHNANH